MSDSDEPEMPAPCTLPLLLTIPDVARQLGLSERQVYNLINAGRLERRKLGDRPRSPARITRDSLYAYIESLRAPGGSSNDTDVPMEES